MAEDIKDMIMHDIRRDVLLEVLKTKKRMDGRGFFDYRDIDVQFDVIQTAEGSALARIGTTQILCGLKVDILSPFPDRPDEGVLITNAEFPPLASPTFEAGPPDENCIELARVVDRGIRSAECVNLKELFLEEGKVLGLFLDIYVLDHGGNMTDAAALAALGALKNARIPKYEDGKLIRDEVSKRISLSSYPISTSFVKVGDYVLIDPTFEENLASDAKITITTTEKHICAVQKGHGTFSQQQLDMLIEMSFKKGKELRKHIMD